jgi:1-acyl-sn-glycerol-3-phosphate acyltransferase
MIVMCNHLSNADPFIMCKSLFPLETKFISKSSLFQVRCFCSNSALIDRRVPNRSRSAAGA